MSDQLPLFDSPRGEAEVQAAYDRVLGRWSAPYTELMVPTSFGRTHVIASGPEGAEPIVFLHALFATATVWYPNAGPLSARFRTFAVDIVGEPNRSLPSRPITKADEFVEWLDELLDGLGAERATLVGNSFGAFLSALYAMRRPARVRKLVLIGPAATFHQIVPFYVHMFGPKMLWMLFPKALALRHLLRHSLNWMRDGLPLDPAWGALFYQVLEHGKMTNQVFPRVYTREEASQVAAPTLLLIGDHERIYRPEDAIRAARQLMPNLEAEIIPNAHHIAALAQPAVVDDRIIRFLQRDGEVKVE